jgi:hypothetical protein
LLPALRLAATGPAPGAATLVPTMRTPEIELWWWEGCPSTQRALDELRAAMRDLDLDADAIRTREIRTDAEAEHAGFTGSPTILIDGVDLAGDAGAQQPGSEPGLSCRVYRRRDGRISPTPDPDDLRESLRQAVARPEAGLR